MTTTTNIQQKVQVVNEDLSKLVVDLKNANGFNPGFKDSFDANEVPVHTRNRLTKYGIDLSKGYPERPGNIPHFLDEGYAKLGN